ncbi:Outer membrane porin protein BP0840 precursor [Phocoenobacter uteri]|uniref:Outer membrane porin protein BP0840 n=1 Tax=Phocoenobacter uteri TaxID=146806 RepID=A0A379CAE5_9PAST|nr:porin [Phocoenobacter uteri]MDG6881086.1 hypothetical protein [Phocoenobacter uteri]SUB59108.1 Outer membrane porin protein BP0840 precursor [Phocoenobacter uteri]
MKKTLIALTVAALASTSASAVTVYNQDGMNVNVFGEIKYTLGQDKITVKEDGVKQPESTESHTKLKNAGTKLGVHADYDLGNGAYAFGEYKLQMKSGDAKLDKAFIGFGQKEVGQLSFGQQVTMADDIGEATFDNIYGVGVSVLPTGGDRTVAYRYKAVDGWTFGADYVFGENGEKKVKYEALGFEKEVPLKNAFQVGAHYSKDALTFEAGLGRVNHKSVDSKDDYVDAIEAAFGYTIDNVRLGLDLGYGIMKYGNDKDKLFHTAMGAKVAVTDSVDLFGTYAYTKIKFADKDEKAEKIHGLNVGVDYKLAKNVSLFAEAQYQKGKQDKHKTTQKAVGVGMKIVW